MNTADVVRKELARQADFGYEPSWLDFVVAGKKARNIEIDTTIKAVLGQTPEHCSQHEEFVDECMTCHDVCNENIDWDLFEKLREVKRAGTKELADWVEKNKALGSYGDEDILFLGEEWQAELKQLGVKKED